MIHLLLLIPELEILIKVENAYLVENLATAGDETLVFLIWLWGKTHILHTSVEPCVYQETLTLLGLEIQDENALKAETDKESLVQVEL